MKIRILFFAQLRDITKETEITIDIAKESTIEDLKHVLTGLYPEIEKHLESVSFAIDNEYVERDRSLDERCTVALIPPISGG